MALRYWVGGSGTWDAVSTANWSATSGGASGASVPTTADDVVLNASSGAGTVTLGANVVARIMTMTGFTGTLAFSTFKISLAGNAATVFTGATTFTTSGDKLIELTYTGSTGARTLATGAMTEANALTFSVPAGGDQLNPGTSAVRGYIMGAARTNANIFGVGIFTVYGDVTIYPAAGSTGSSGAAITFAATSGVQVLTSNGTTINKPITVNAPGATVRLADALVIAATQRLTVTSGTFDANDKNVTAETFAAGTGSPVLLMGSGTWTITGAGAAAWNGNQASLTVTPGTATISLTSASAKTFAGGGKTWPTLNQAGAGTLTIQQSNTFANITNTVQPATITFTAGTTQTVSAFGVSGTSGNLITLNTTVAGSQATLSDNSGTNSLSFTSVKDLAATGGAAWLAYTANGNVDAGNNTGWLFAPAPVVTTPVTAFDLRSFTEKRRF